MDRLISADAILNDTGNYFLFDGDKYYHESIIRYASEAVIRCKDCRWWAGYGSSDTIAECSNCGGDWGADEYCSCGERGEDEETTR